MKILWNKEIYHYGTKGHSGRYPPGSGKNPKTGPRSILLRTRKTTALKELKEKGIIPKNATGQNVEKWGSSPDTNVLYLTGASGTGKSTVAKKLGGKNIDVINLDSYFDNNGGPENKNLNKWLSSNKSKYKDIRLPKEKISMDDWQKVVDKFADDLDAYGKHAYQNRRKVIVEGVELLDDTMRPNKKYFADKPFILLNTNSITNIYRANKRDKVRLSVGDIQNRLAWRKDIKKLKRSNHLMHYGTKGHSGRYPAGSGKNPKTGPRTVFVSGSSKTQNPDSIYFRKKLPKQVTDQLDEHMRNKKRIVVGDAPGIDRQVQNYLKSKNYNNVELYGPGQQIRYAANKKWKQNLIDAPEYEPGSKEWLAKKDIAMTNAATEGLAIVLKDGANATRKNVSRLISQNKKVKVYELNDQGEALDRFMSDREIRRIMKTKINKI